MVEKRDTPRRTTQVTGYFHPATKDRLDAYATTHHKTQSAALEDLVQAGLVAQTSAHLEEAALPALRAMVREEMIRVLTSALPHFTESADAAERAATMAAYIGWQLLHHLHDADAPTQIQQENGSATVPWAQAVALWNKTATARNDKTKIRQKRSPRPAPETGRDAS